MGWFSPTIEYEGKGRSEFQNPKIAICGPVKILLNESGDLTIEMEVRESDSPGLTIFDVGRILSGNKCIRLNITTKEGIFSAEGEILYTDRESIVSGQGASLWLKFVPLRSFFYVKNAKSATYWVLPLLNFVSNFSLRPPDLDNHPLRINNKKNLIKFKFNDALGFIEPLSDYIERERMLLEGNIQNTLTSVMIGEIGRNSIEYDNLKNWFPFDFLGLLGLATGSEVSAQCIEFRDAEGGLVRRMHLRFKTPCYLKGHVAIDEVYNDGIGQLLNSFQSSEIYNDCSDESYFTAVLENLIRGGLGRLTSEDKLSHIFRGLECLCEKYKTKAKDLREDLDAESKRRVEKVVTDAIKIAERDLLKLVEAAKSEGDNQVEVIERICRKMKQCQPFSDTAYGRSVIDLMHKFDLCDAEIVEAYYEQHPRWDGKKWVQVLPIYRGKTMHSGYFKFNENKHYQEDVPRICSHLQDILLRIVLKMVGYGGTYHPTVKQEMATDRVDWVNCDTSASDLGYV